MAVAGPEFLGHESLLFHREGQQVRLNFDKLKSFPSSASVPAFLYLPPCSVEVAVRTLFRVALLGARVAIPSCLVFSDLVTTVTDKRTRQRDCLKLVVLASAIARSR